MNRNLLLGLALLSCSAHLFSADDTITQFILQHEVSMASGMETAGLPVVAVAAISGDGRIIDPNFLTHLVKAKLVKCRFQGRNL